MLKDMSVLIIHQLVIFLPMYIYLTPNVVQVVMKLLEIMMVLVMLIYFGAYLKLHGMKQLLTLTLDITVLVDIKGVVQLFIMEIKELD